MNWCAASKLKIGDEIFSVNGFIKVSKIEKKSEKKQIIINIQIEDNKNFYVTRKKLLVHNDSYIPYSKKMNEKNEEKK